MQTVDAAGLRIGDDHPTRIMGVLNVSVESPYDASVFDDPGEAARYVDEELIDEGADIVDVGLESANKRFEVLSAEEELERLDTAVDPIERVGGDAIYSIETRYASVAEAALDRGFDMVNDICGFADPELRDLCAEREVAVVKMASPPDLERPGAVEETDWATLRSERWASEADYVDQLYAALERDGLTDETIVDPAFGGWSEAKTLADDRETFRRLREFRALDRPILVSINRKNFLKSLADRDTAEALPVSLAATAMAIERGAHVVRTHDVAETKDAARIGDAFAPTLVSEDVRGLTVEELDVERVGDAKRYLDGSTLPPDQATSRVAQVSGLDGDERAALVQFAAESGVSFVGDEPTILLGTDAAFRRLANALNGHDRLAEACLALHEGVQ